MAGRFLRVKRWLATGVLLLLWLRLCAGSHKVGFQISRKIVKKNWKIQFSSECCPFSQSNDKASGEGCAPFVCRLAQSRFSFPMQELGKVGKSCFPMSVVYLYCPMARPVGRVLLWTPPEVSVSFHWFLIYFLSFSLYFHWLSFYFHWLCLYFHWFSEYFHWFS